MTNEWTGVSIINAADKRERDALKADKVRLHARCDFASDVLGEGFPTRREQDAAVDHALRILAGQEDRPMPAGVKR